MVTKLSFLFVSFHVQLCETKIKKWNQFGYETVLLANFCQNVPFFSRPVSAKYTVCYKPTPAWILFLERGFTTVILTISKHGEFKQSLISRDLMEIELNGVHFRKLCFFELFATEIGFFDRIFFLLLVWFLIV